MLSRGFEFGLKIVQGAWLNHAIQDISLVLFLISSFSLVVIVGLVVFIGGGVIRLLGLFT